MEIKGRTALVTGAGRRLGRAIAIELGRRGAAVAVHYNESEQGARETVGMIESDGGRAIAVRADQGDPKAISAAVSGIEGDLGPIYALVNSAAIFERTPFHESGVESLERHVDINLRGPYAWIQAIAGGMKQRGAGKIVNLLDVSIARPWPAYLPYAASKAGLEALTRGLARALAPEIQVNGVSPGVILPPEDWDDEETAQILKRVPMRRPGIPEDIARTVLFLIDGPDYITGAIIPVDGGQSVV